MKYYFMSVLVLLVLSALYPGGLGYVHSYAGKQCRRHSI